MTDTRAEMRAILTRAATCEAERQAAQERRDSPAELAAERELRDLWKRYGELERAERVA